MYILFYITDKEYKEKYLGSYIPEVFTETAYQKIWKENQRVFGLG